MGAADDLRAGTGVKTARRIRRFIEEQLLEERYDGDDALADAVLDSMAIEELITYLEDAYGIRFEEEETVIGNFATIDTLAGLVDRKRAQAKAGGAT